MFIWIPSSNTRRNFVPSVRDDSKSSLQTHDFELVVEGGHPVDTYL